MSQLDEMINQLTGEGLPWHVSTCEGGGYFGMVAYRSSGASPFPTPVAALREAYATAKAAEFSARWSGHGD